LRHKVKTLDEAKEQARRAEFLRTQNQLKSASILAIFVDELSALLDQVMSLEAKDEGIFNNWICKYGIPAQLVTDQGKEFVANVCQSLWNKLNIVHITTSARHPQANAQAEVVNKTIAGT